MCLWNLKRYTTYMCMIVHVEIQKTSAAHFFGLGLDDKQKIFYYPVKKKKKYQCDVKYFLNKDTHLVSNTQVQQASRPLKMVLAVFVKK